MLMPGVALIAHFAGDPDHLATSFRAAATRYADLPGTLQPTTAVLLRNKDGIAVTLVWPDDTSLQPFRSFLRDVLTEFDLPHPRVEHLRADASSWAAMTQH
jgi:hypothetical protein